MPRRERILRDTESPAISKRLEERVRELARFLDREAPGPFVTGSRKDDSKWLSRRYCMRKLGL